MPPAHPSRSPTQPLSRSAPPARDDRAVTLASTPAADSFDASFPGEATGWRAVGFFCLRLLAVAAGLGAVCYGYQLLLSNGDPAHPHAFLFPTRYFLYGATFLTATTLGRGRRGWAMAAVSLVCGVHLWLLSPPMVPWVAVLIPALFLALGRANVPGLAASWRFWIGVLLGLVVVPKGMQVILLHNAHGSFLDENQNLFSGLFLRYAYYYYERRRGLIPAGGFWDHVAYLLFVPQLTGMLNLPPAEMAARWGFGAETLRRGFLGVGWALAKIPVILFLGKQVLPAWGYTRGFAALQAAPGWQVWACLLASYLYWFFLISAKFDLMCALFRFFGANVDDNFHWPLLATSPVTLWRRWNVYNRRLLLKFVYFPLGGRERHAYRNILATFLASALLLHTGYLGSPWWGLNPSQLCDWLVYFAGQGTLVCATFWWLDRPFWVRLPAGPRGALAGLGWAFTLGSSAWLHVLPLAAGNLLNDATAPIPDLWQRLKLMAHALGLR